MNLYIQVQNGVPINHPATEENLILCFKQIPEGWEPFVRTPHPKLTPYQYVEQEEHSYAKIDGVWTDVWAVKDFTAEEKQRRQQRKKNSWASQSYAENFAAWVFNEATCAFDPPIAYPTDGKLYQWSGVDGAWKEAPTPPQTGKGHEFNYSEWIWVEV